MRLLKMLGFAALAVAAAVLVAGADTTFARGEGEDTVLCEANEHPCALANIYLKETKIAAQGKTTFKVMLFGTQKVNCTTSYVEGITRESLGQKGASETELEARLTKIEFLNCTVESTGANCSVTALQLPYQALLEQEASTGNGHMFVFGGEGGGQPGVVVECSGLLEIDCVYKGAETNQQMFGVEGVNLQVEGGIFGHVIAKQAQLKEVPAAEHEACPGNEPKWDGNYTVTAPAAPLWVSHAF